MNNNFFSQIWKVQENELLKLHQSDDSSKRTKDLSGGVNMLNNKTMYIIISTWTFYFFVKFLWFVKKYYNKENPCETNSDFGTYKNTESNSENTDEKIKKSLLRCWILYEFGFDARDILKSIKEQSEVENAYTDNILDSHKSKNNDQKGIFNLTQNTIEKISQSLNQKLKITKGVIHYNYKKSILKYVLSEEHYRIMVITALPIILYSICFYAISYGLTVFLTVTNPSNIIATISAFSMKNILINYKKEFHQLISINKGT
jgi:CRISPR/Cas system-associated exonuclease Cas4 (RecB family)